MHGGSAIWMASRKDLTFTAQGRAIVGLDTRKPRQNLAMLKPAVAQLRDRGQSLS